MPPATSSAPVRRLVNPVYLELVADNYATEQQGAIQTANPTIILIGVLDELRELRALLESKMVPTQKRRRR